jgi:hypothetical protein
MAAEIIRIQCQHCGGGIEFDADSARQESNCPHCGKTIWLDVSSATSEAFDPEDQPVPVTNYKSLVVKIALAVFLLAALVAGTFWIHKHWQTVLHVIGQILRAVFAVLLLCGALAIYFIPTIVANSRKKTNATAIFVMNFFLGWTFLGWVGALIWACLVETPK